uniref:Uncharacterized protein n=1 Tax=Syphacia muris TaxID=451379 RepID=A0A0N5B022_9BILA
MAAVNIVTIFVVFCVIGNFATVVRQKRQMSPLLDLEYRFGPIMKLEALRQQGYKMLPNIYGQDASPPEIVVDNTEAKKRYSSPANDDLYKRLLPGGPHRAFSPTLDLEYRLKLAKFLEEAGN